MTRKEKIQEAAEHYEQVDATNLACDYGWGDRDIQQQCFKAGVEWADQHPRKGLWDSEKVCKWIEEHSGDYMTLENDEEGELQAVFYKTRLINDLRKAMED